MGQRYLFDNLNWSIDKENAVRKLKVSEDDLGDFGKVFEKTLSLLKPVYYAGKEAVTDNDGENVTIGGVSFTSRVVAVNLKTSEWAYPYVGTSGRAAYEYALSLCDDLYKFWADQLCEMALKSAAKDFMLKMRALCASVNLSVLAPGSVVDFHISQQKPLFALLGNVYENTGIILESSYLMRPVKSNSGLIYVSEKHFESCELCSKENCPNRRAPYDKAKLEREYFA